MNRKILAALIIAAMVISIFPTSADLTSAEKEDLKRLTAEMMALETFIDLNANGTMEELALRAINKADELVIKLDPENFQNAKNNKTQLAAVNSKYNRSLVLQTKAYSIPIVSCDVAVSNSAPTTTAETEGQNIAEARDQAWEAHAATAAATSTATQETATATDQSEQVTQNNRLAELKNPSNGELANGDELKEMEQGQSDSTSLVSTTDTGQVANIDIRYGGKTYRWEPVAWQRAPYGNGVWAKTAYYVFYGTVI